MKCLSSNTPNLENLKIEKEDFSKAMLLNCILSVLTVILFPGQTNKG